VLGWAMIAVVVAIVVYNTVVIAIFAVSYLKLMAIKLRYKIKARAQAKVSPTIEKKNKNNQIDEKIEFPTKLKLLQPNFDHS
jgi:hypothetical protein